MLGAQRLKSTRLQMAELEAEKARRANELLNEQVEEYKNDTQAQIDALMEEVSQLRKMVSQSTSGNNNSMLNLERDDSVGESAAWDDEQYLLDQEEERLDQEIREANVEFQRMQAEAALLHKKKEASKKKEDSKKKEATLIENTKAAQHQKREAEIFEKKRKEIELQKEKDTEEVEQLQLLQKKKESEQMQKKKEQVQVQKKLGASVTQQNHQVLFYFLLQFLNFLYECKVLLLSSHSCLVSYFSKETR
jgi:nucleolar protein involved in exit from mitosis